MAKRGRPALYRKEYAEQARKACLLGADNQKLALFFGVSDVTIDRWIAGIPEFSGAVKAGREFADQQVAKSLYQRAIGYEQDAVKIFMPAGADDPVYAPFTERVAPDVTAQIFWLKNRQPDKWREKSEVKHDLSDNLAEILDAAKKRG